LSVKNAGRLDQAMLTVAAFRIIISNVVRNKYIIMQIGELFGSRIAQFPVGYGHSSEIVELLQHDGWRCNSIHQLLHKVCIHV